jgi:dTDP-4-dehydrorhamnose 3,5-epimerase-like enzyme
MVKDKKAKVVRFNQLGDDRGHLVVVEGCKDIPFEISRIFYIYGSDNDVVRGQHANRDSEFVLINVSGKSKVKIDYGDSQEIIELNEPHMGVYIPKMIWKEMYDFSEDSVLLVLSNIKYNPEEYIRDYNEYLALIKG